MSLLQVLGRKHTHELVVLGDVQKDLDLKQKKNQKLGWKFLMYALEKRQ